MTRAVVGAEQVSLSSSGEFRGLSFPQTQEGVLTRWFYEFLDLYEHDEFGKLLKLCGSCRALHNHRGEFFDAVTHDADLRSIVVTDINNFPIRENFSLDSDRAAWVKLELRDKRKALTGVLSFTKENFLALVNRISTGAPLDGIQAIVWRLNGSSIGYVFRDSNWQQLP